MFGVMFCGLVTMGLSVRVMTLGDVGMVSGLLMAARSMVLGCMPMVLRGVFVMLRCFFVMFGHFLFHDDFSFFGCAVRRIASPRASSLREYLRPDNPYAVNFPLQSAAGTAGHLNPDHRELLRPCR
jgi:hypothetical protein